MTFLYVAELLITTSEGIPQTPSPSASNVLLNVSKHDVGRHSLKNTKVSINYSKLTPSLIVLFTKHRREQSKIKQTSK